MLANCPRVAFARGAYPKRTDEHEVTVVAAVRADSEHVPDFVGDIGLEITLRHERRAPDPHVHLHSSRAAEQEGQDL